jgi:hypothetical protein
MDINGGMKLDIYDSMAEGIARAAGVICFMTKAYQDSSNCKLELKFAQQGVPMIPVMMQPDFTAKGWLGILTAGSIWTPMHEPSTVMGGVGKLVVQVRQLIPGMREAGDDVSDSTSEGSGHGWFDVAEWGDAMFSLAEMREELERLRVESTPASAAPPRLTGFVMAPKWFCARCQR